MKTIILRLTSIAALFLFSVTMLIPASASAALPSGCGKGLLGFPHWFEYLVVNSDCQVVGPCVDGQSGAKIDDSQCETAVLNKDNPARLNVSATTTRVILAIIDILLRVAGLVAFVFIVYAGFQFVLSTGDTNKEVAARQTVINAVIGMLISIFAVVIVTFVGRTIQK